MLSATVAVTGVLTIASLFVASGHLGPGFLIVLAMLGPAAAWLLPGLLAQALPAGVAGGILLAGANTDADTRPSARDAATLTFVCAALVLYFVGWAIPEAYTHTSAATARYTARRTETPPGTAVTPARKTLPDLLADRTPEARTELRRRLASVGLTLLFGLAAAAALTLRVRWNQKVALAATAVLFIVQMQRWTAAFPQP